MNKGFAAILERLTLLGVGLCFLASAVGHLFGDRYPFELLLNFPLQYATVAIGASALLLSVRRRLAAVISALFAAVQLLLLLPLYLSVETAHQSAAGAIGALRRKRSLERARATDRAAADMPHETLDTRRCNRGPATSARFAHRHLRLG